MLFARAIYPEMFDPRNNIATIAAIKRLELYDRVKFWCNHKDLKRLPVKHRKRRALLNASIDLSISYQYALKLERQFK